MAFSHILPYFSCLGIIGSLVRTGLISGPLLCVQAQDLSRGVIRGEVKKAQTLLMNVIVACRTL
jgi:hypothetical protein